MCSFTSVEAVATAIVPSAKNATWKKHADADKNKSQLVEKEMNIYIILTYCILVILRRLGALNLGKGRRREGITGAGAWR